MSKTRVELRIETNFVNHSQANALTHAGLLSQQSLDFGFLAALRNEDDKEFIPTFVPYGSPVNSTTMEESLGTFGLELAGTYTNEGDFVAIVLGGNKGKNEQATLWERIDALQYILDLNKAKYPLDAHGNAQPVSSHSTYECQKNCGNGASNEQSF